MQSAEMTVPNSFTSEKVCFSIFYSRLWSPLPRITNMSKGSLTVWVRGSDERAERVEMPFSRSEVDHTVAAAVSDVVANIDHAQCSVTFLALFECVETIHICKFVLYRDAFSIDTGSRPFCEWKSVSKDAL